VEKSIWLRWVNVLLLGIPIVLLRGRLGLEEGPLLAVLAALSLIPLSGFLESAVEELEELLGEFLGGFLHMTFGNVAELTIALSLLLQQTPGETSGSQIVLGSIAGVIIRNSLLGLGVATVFGALKNGRMAFNADRAGQYSTIFALAVIGLCLPTLASYLAQANNPGAGDALPSLLVFQHYSLSFLVSLVLIGSYLAYTLFAIFRVRDGVDLVEQSVQRRLERARQRINRRAGRPAPAPVAVAVAARSQAAGASGVGAIDDYDSNLLGVSPADPAPGMQALFQQEREQAEYELTERVERATPKRTAKAQYAEIKRQERRARAAERAEGRAEGGEKEGALALRHPVLRGLIALVVLGVAALGVVYMSEAFAGSVELLARENEKFVNPFFVGLIIIPVVGGLVEMYGTTGMAQRNLMEVVMGVTAGASIQMILVVVPILVIVGHYTNHPLLLIFAPLEVVIFGAATFLFMLLTRDGESTILEGVQLCSLWALLAATAYFLPPQFAG
jgi:Ca2+/H+ antiporter